MILPTLRRPWMLTKRSIVPTRRVAFLMISHQLINLKKMITFRLLGLCILEIAVTPIKNSNTTRSSILRSLARSIRMESPRWKRRPSKRFLCKDKMRGISLINYLKRGFFRNRTTIKWLWIQNPFKIIHQGPLLK